MSAESVTTVLAVILVWCVFSTRLERFGLTAPIVFVAAGFVCTDVVGLLHLDVEPELVKVMAEVTLVWVLFGDASAVQVSSNSAAGIGICRAVVGQGGLETVNN